MSQHTPISMVDTSLSPPVLVYSKQQKNRRNHFVRWGGLVMILGWLVFFVG